MDKIYHEKILTHTLQARFSPRALETIIAANLGQDSLRGLIGHPEYHFDDNAFAEGQAYIEKQRNIIFDCLRTGKSVEEAWRALGRLTHAVQDFYAHSNYVQLWAASLQPDGGATTMSNIAPLDKDILNDERLRSGKVYWLEVISFIPALRPLARRLLPKDSHAAMNLDTPLSGPLFPAAMAAARKRTLHEVDVILAEMTAEEKVRFLDVAQSPHTELPS